MTLQVLHISDTHGEFPKLLTEGEIVIHSGDFCPNFIVTDRYRERLMQWQWLSENAEDIKDWLGGRRMYVCSGNHDFVTPGVALASCGLDVVSLDHICTKYRDEVLYGIPEVPYFGGVWNHETTPDSSGKHRNGRASDQTLEDIVNRIPDATTILVAHAPPHGILDRVYHGELIGNAALRKALDGGFKPKAVLSGHVHEAQGMEVYRGIIISNAARTQRVISL